MFHKQELTMVYLIVNYKYFLELKNLDASALNFRYDDIKMNLYIFDEKANIKLDLSKHFPFDAPEISIDLKDKE